MGKSKKKEKYVPLTGLTGIGEDYNIYIMAPREKIIGYLIGFVAGFLAAQIMFGVVIASIVIGAAVGFYAIPVYRRYLQERRRKAILLQFRDMLDSLSNSFSAGKNTPDAFTDAYSDLKLAYGEQAPIVKEMAIIVSGLHNNFVIEDLLRDMSARCGIDDINSFAETFAVCNRLGGNLKKVVVDSRDIISDKIEIEMEIQTTVAANKNEINIMCVMPFVIIAMMGTMGQASITANTPLNVLVKLIAIFMFVIAYGDYCDTVLYVCGVSRCRDRFAADEKGQAAGLGPHGALCVRRSGDRICVYADRRITADEEGKCKAGTDRPARIHGIGVAGASEKSDR